MKTSTPRFSGFKRALIPFITFIILSLLSPALHAAPNQWENLHLPGAHINKVIKNGDFIYVATASVGVWMGTTDSTTGVVSWSNVSAPASAASTERLAGDALYVNTLVVQSNFLYAATENGVWRSVINTNGTLLGWRSVDELAAAPLAGTARKVRSLMSLGGQLWAGTLNGIWSIDPASPTATWARQSGSDSLTSPTQISAMVYDSGRSAADISGNIYVYVAGSNGLWQGSIDIAGIITWSSFYGTVSALPTSARESIISITVFANDVYVVSRDAGVFRAFLSAGGIPSWESFNGTVDGRRIYVTGTTPPAGQVVVHPLSFVAALRSGSPVFYVGASTGVYKGVNGTSGIEWTKTTDGISSTFLNQGPVSSLFLEGNTLLAGSFGLGVFKASINATDGALAWASANGQGDASLAINAPTDLTVIDSDNLLAVGSFGFLKTSNHGDSWEPVHAGLGPDYFYYPSSLSQFGTRTYIGCRSGFWGELCPGIYRNNAAFTAWEIESLGFPGPVISTQKMIRWGDSLYALVHYLPPVAGSLPAMGVFKSTPAADGSLSWSLMNGTTIGSSLSPSDIWSDMVVFQDSLVVVGVGGVWQGTPSGDVFSWRKISGTSLDPVIDILSVAVDRSSLYVVADHSSTSQRLWRGSVSGPEFTWAAVETPSFGVSTTVNNRMNTRGLLVVKGQVFVSTRSGVWRGIESGSGFAWSRLGEPASVVNTSSISLIRNDPNNEALFYAGVNSSGLWRYNLQECGDGLINTQVEGCDDSNRTNLDGCNNNCKTENFSLSVSPTSISIPAGQSLDVTLTAARQNIADAVTINLSGPPAGISASPLVIPAYGTSPATLTPASGTMTINVASSVSPGTYTLHLQTSLSSFWTRSVDVTVNVTAASSGGSGGGSGGGGAGGSSGIGGTSGGGGGIGGGSGGAGGISPLGTGGSSGHGGGSGGTAGISDGSDPDPSASGDTGGGCSCRLEE